MLWACHLEEGILQCIVVDGGPKVPIHVLMILYFYFAIQFGIESTKCPECMIWYPWCKLVANELWVGVLGGAIAKITGHV